MSRKSIVTADGFYSNYVGINQVFAAGIQTHRIGIDGENRFTLIPGTYYSIDTEQNGNVTIDLQSVLTGRTPVYTIIVKDSAFTSGHGLVLPENVVWAGGETPDLAGKNNVITIVGNVATCSATAGGNSGTGYVDSGDDSVDYVLFNILKEDGTPMEPEDVVVGTVIPIEDENDNPINTGVDAALGVYFDPHTGKNITIQRDENDSTLFTVIAVEDADFDAIYSMQDIGVDAYYHYTNNGVKLLYCGVGVGNATEHVVGNQVAQHEYDVPLNPSLYVDISKVDANATAIEFTEIADIPPHLQELLDVVPISGRFKAGSSMNVTLPTGWEFSSKNPDLENEHVYEYSIFDRICNITDVTPAT